MDLKSTDTNLDKAVQPLLPKTVLVIYEDKNEQTYYIEKSGIVNGSPTGFHPVTSNELKQILGSITAAEKGLVRCEGIMPRCLLFMDVLMGDFTLIWWRPKSPKQLKFNKECKLKNITVEVPALVYEATRKSLRVFSLAKSNAPKMKTQLCEAPFFNIFSDGRVCMGNTKINIPLVTSPEHIIKEWENGFWNSEFTMSGSTSTLPIWKKIIREKKGKYPVTELKLHKIHPSLNSLIHGNTKKTKSSLRRRRTY